MNCTTTRGELQHNYLEVEVSLHVVTTSLTYLAHEAVVSAVETLPLPRRPGLKKAVRHVTHVARLDFPPGRVVTFLRSKHGLGFGRKKTTCLSRHASSLTVMKAATSRRRAERLNAPNCSASVTCLSARLSLAS